MNADATAKLLIENGLPLDSVAQLRNVVVKLLVLGCPFVIFVLVMVVRDPQARLFISTTEVALSIAVMGTVLNLDFRPHRVLPATFHIVKWWALLLILLKVNGITHSLQSLIDVIGNVGLGLQLLQNVEGRIWALLALMIIAVPSAVRLFSLRDVRTLASAVPGGRARLLFEVSSITFFLVSNTFGRRIRAAWQVSSEKLTAARCTGARGSKIMSFTGDFTKFLLRQGLEVVMLAASLVGERGFRGDGGSEDRWGWYSRGGEDYAAGVLLILLLLFCASGVL